LKTFLLQQLFRFNQFDWSGVFILVFPAAFTVLLLFIYYY